MRLILLGPPGCGKGTQGQMIAERYHIPQLSTGEILRRAVSEKTKVGEAAGRYINKGELVPDDVIIKLMAERVREEDCRKGYIFDGFPRTIAQAEGAAADAVINIAVPEDEVVKRLSGRRQCSECGAVYHVESSPPKDEGACDKCGGALYLREDDKEATILKRLKVYKAETSPLIDYYRKRGLLKEVNGLGSTGKVFTRICSLIDEMRLNPLSPCGRGRKAPRGPRPFSGRG